MHNEQGSVRHTHNILYGAPWDFDLCFSEPPPGNGLGTAVLTKWAAEDWNGIPAAVRTPSKERMASIYSHFSCLLSLLHILVNDECIVWVNLFMCIRKCMYQKMYGVWVVHHILGRLNVRKEDRREMVLVESRIGGDERDERLKLSGDEVIEFLNESSCSKNKKTKSM